MDIFVHRKTAANDLLSSPRLTLQINMKVTSENNPTRVNPFRKCEIFGGGPEDNTVRVVLPT